MNDNRSDKVKEICNFHTDVDHGCGDCPLQKPCQMRAGDTKAIYIVRMNKAAEEMGEQ